MKRHDYWDVFPVLQFSEQPKNFCCAWRKGYDPIWKFGINSGDRQHVKNNGGEKKRIFVNWKLKTGNRKLDFILSSLGKYWFGFRVFVLTPNSELWTFQLDRSSGSGLPTCRLPIPIYIGTVAYAWLSFPSRLRGSGRITLLGLTSLPWLPANVYF